MKNKGICPHCGKKIGKKGDPYKPFCSERCKLIDLGNWASEKYRIAGKKVEGEGPKKDGGDDEE